MDCCSGAVSHDARRRCDVVGRVSSTHSSRLAVLRISTREGHVRHIESYRRERRHLAGWQQAGVYHAGSGRTLTRVSSAGGQPSEFMRLTKEQTGYAFPSFLPDGRHFLFYSYAASDEVAGVYVSSLDAPAESKRLAGSDTAAAYD